MILTNYCQLYICIHCTKYISSADFFYCNLLELWRLGVYSSEVEDMLTSHSPGFKNVGNRRARWLSG